MTRGMRPSRSRKEEEHRPEIEKIADEERSRLPVEKGDATRRVTRRVKDLQDALTEIDAITMLEPAGRRAPGNPRAGVETARKPARSTGSGEKSAT